jgi:hypothetical protein
MRSSFHKNKSEVFLIRPFCRNTGRQNGSFVGDKRNCAPVLGKLEDIVGESKSTTQKCNVSPISVFSIEDKRSIFVAR